MNLKEKIKALQPFTENYEYSAEIGLDIRLRRRDLWEQFKQEHPEIARLKLSQAVGFAFLLFLENSLSAEELLNEEIQAFLLAEEYMIVEIEASLNCLENSLSKAPETFDLKTHQAQPTSQAPIWLYQSKSSWDYLGSKWLDKVIAASLDRYKQNIKKREIIQPTKKELLTAHSSFYIDGLNEAALFAENNQALLLTPETVLSKESQACWQESAGALLTAAKETNKLNRFETPLPLCICWTRPGSHHASSNKAGGTCLINNIAVAAANVSSKSAYRAKRVAVLDLDAHHGNGTERIFYHNDSVLTLSVHQANPFFPGTGFETSTGAYSGAGKNQNYEVKKSDSWIQAAERALKKLESFSPEVIFLELSADAHAQDPVSDLQANKNDFYQIGRRLKETNKQIIVEIGASTSKEALFETLTGFIDGWQSIAGRAE